MLFENNFSQLDGSFLLLIIVAAVVLATYRARAGLAAATMAAAVASKTGWPIYE